jgi:hypothetical protein
VYCCCYSKTGMSALPPDGSERAPFCTHAQVVHRWQEAIKTLNANANANARSASSNGVAGVFRKRGLRRPTNFTVHVSRQLNQTYWDAFGVSASGRQREGATDARLLLHRWLRANHASVCYVLHSQSHPLVLEHRDASDPDRAEWPSRVRRGSAAIVRFLRALAHSSKRPRDDHGRTENCSICFDPLTAVNDDPLTAVNDDPLTAVNDDARTVALRCGHRFHTRCMARLMHAKITTCPLCRARIHSQ